MLDIALKFLTSELNTHISTQMSSTPQGQIVVLSNLVDHTGKYVFASPIAASVIYIEEDRIFKSQTPDRVYTNGQHIVLEPELKLNLHVIFAAKSEEQQNYDQALKYISHVLTFFQCHSAFTSVEYPSLDPRIEKLTMELQSLSYEQLNQIWAFIGAKQLPSVIYKVRMVSLQRMVPSVIHPPIMEINTNLYSK